MELSHEALHKFVTSCSKTPGVVEYDFCVTDSCLERVLIALGFRTEYSQRCSGHCRVTYRLEDDSFGLILGLGTLPSKTTAATGTATEASTPTGTGNSATPPDALVEDVLNAYERHRQNQTLDNRGNLYGALRALLFSRRGDVRVDSPSTPAASPGP
jgi:hypothetical protein